MERGGGSVVMKLSKNKSTMLHLVNYEAGWGKPAPELSFSWTASHSVIG